MISPFVESIPVVASHPKDVANLKRDLATPPLNLVAQHRLLLVLVLATIIPAQHWQSSFNSHQNE